MVKFIQVAVLAVVAISSCYGEAPLKLRRVSSRVFARQEVAPQSGPYPAAGFKPERAFELPEADDLSGQQESGTFAGQEYNPSAASNQFVPPAQEYGTPSREYGAPAQGLPDPRINQQPGFSTEQPADDQESAEDDEEVESVEGNQIDEKSSRFTRPQATAAKLQQQPQQQQEVSFVPIPATRFIQPTFAKFQAQPIVTVQSQQYVQQPFLAAQPFVAQPFVQAYTAQYQNW